MPGRFRVALSDDSMGSFSELAYKDIGLGLPDQASDVVEGEFLPEEHPKITWERDWSPKAERSLGGYLVYH